MSTKNLASALVLALLGLGLASGCTVSAKSSTEYIGSQSTQTFDYFAGGNLTVTGVNGSIRVVAGTGSQVVVTFQPVDIRGSDERDQAIAEMQNNLTLSASTDANNNVNVVTSRNGGSTGLGAKVEIAIPAAFNGQIRIAQGNGGVTVSTVAAATLVDIQNTGTGDCKVAGAPTVTNTVVHCGWDISVSNVSDNVDIVSDNTLDSTTVSVGLASISAASTGGSVSLTSGQVSMTMPASGNFTLQAMASGGTVNLGSVPGTCTPAEASAGSKSMTCGSGGPNYSVTAGDSSGNVGNITVAYQ